MPTLMSRQTFDTLVQVRETIVRDFPDAESPAYVFVPWSGSTLVESGRGIYFVGIALSAEGPYGNQTFDERLKATEDFVVTNEGTSGHFWPWINSMTSDLLGAKALETRARWGWSNLLKIAGASGRPNTWPGELKSQQAEACKAALGEEFSRLRNSLIVIASNDPYGALPKELAELKRDAWDKDDDAGTWSFYEESRGNAFVHCYHPAYFADDLPAKAAAAIVSFARRKLPPF